MRLDLRVLWFEDSFEELSAGITRIKRYLEKQGYGLNITNLENLLTLGDLAERQRQGNEFDLIVVDYNLDNVLGTDAAEAVRRLFPFTRILFYSGQFDRRGLRKLMSEKGVEGVFCEARGGIIDRLQEILDSIVADNNRLAGMRGLAAEIVGRCDDHLRQALQMVAGLDESKAFKKIMEKAIKGNKSAADALGKCENVADLLKCRAVTSAHLHMATISLTKGTIEQSLHDCLRVYDTEMLKPRNDLSHAVQSQSNDGAWSLSGDSGLDMNDFPKLRINFGKHLENCRLVAEGIASHIAQNSSDNTPKG